eukprot:XP_001700448.1 hydroxyproline-rich cell wall protein [Chlamydomonas reinhardtii]
MGVMGEVPGVSIHTTKAQPYLHELSAFSAYVIPANDKMPYLDAEDAAFNLWKPLELREYVQAGGSLILLDGSTGHNPRPGSSGNSFTGKQSLPQAYRTKALTLFLTLPVSHPIPNPHPAGMLDLLLGSEGAAHCKGYLYGRDLPMYLRLSDQGALGNIHTPIMVKPNRGLSGMTCTGEQPGEPIYSGRADGSADAGLSAARLWHVGQGRIIWIGSSYTMPKIRAFREVLTGAIVDSQFPDTAPTRSPPPSPPPAKASPPPPRPPPQRSPSPPPPIKYLHTDPPPTDFVTNPPPDWIQPPPLEDWSPPPVKKAPPPRPPPPRNAGRRLRRQQ